LIVVGRIFDTQVRYNLIVGDAKSREGTYINASTRPLGKGRRPNLVKDNLYRDVPTFRNGSPIHVGRNARGETYRLRVNKVAAADPAFTGTNCSSFVPRDALAKRYGRYSTFFGPGL
jgi:hypothetical protein